MRKKNVGQKKCYSCDKCVRYYIKGETRYKEIKYGWCKECRKTVSIHGLCEKYEEKKRKTEVNRYVKYYLNEILLQLKQIRQIIEEENER